ncbi:MAG: DUF2007 domain-containing protein [Geminicoccaceae bacterium]|nr:DUF2007 domain-containing protein [Geminicoccaceae bacterium]
MRELLRTNDLVHISWVRSVLDEAGIETVVLDEAISGVEGSIGAFPRRIMVPEDRLEAARAALERAARDLPARD